jgi:mRNA interferase RelE/StbE
MKVFTTAPFDRDYKRLPPNLQRTAARLLALLAENTSHPSLRIKKLSGETAAWEIRMTRGYRITFDWEGDRATLRRVGSHNILRNP